MGEMQAKVGERIGGDSCRKLVPVIIDVFIDVLCYCKHLCYNIVISVWQTTDKSQLLVLALIKTKVMGTSRFNGNGIYMTLKISACLHNVWYLSNSSCCDLVFH